MRDVLIRFGAWLDADIKAGVFNARPLSLVLGFLPLIVIGAPASLLKEPWKTALLSLALALTATWVVWWLLRTLKYLLSTDFRNRRR